MQRKQFCPPALLRLAAGQGGVIARHQAQRLISRRSVDRLVEERSWFRLSRGIYHVGLSPSWLSWAWAGLLTTRGPACLGGLASLYVDDMWQREPWPILIHSAAGSHRADPHWTFMRAARVPHGSPPRSAAAAAYVDAWPSLLLGDAHTLLGRLLQRGLARPEDLAAAVEAHPRLPRRKDLKDLLRLGAAGEHSPLEHDYGRLVENAHALPRAKRQQRLAGGVADCVYDEFATVVELDGRLGHVDEGRFRDLRRDNRNTARGLATLRFGWQDVHENPCAVAHQVALLLQRGGWRGDFERCSRCRDVHPV